MSSEEEIITKRDVVNFLWNSAPRITPASGEFKTEFVNYLCSKLSIEKSQVSEKIEKDISKISSFFSKKEYGHKIERVFQKHSAFFDCPIKIIKRAAPSAPTTVIIFFKKSSVIIYLYTIAYIIHSIYFICYDSVLHFIKLLMKQNTTT